MNEMKIAVVSDSRVPGERANSIAVVNTAQAFAELGHDVDLILPNRSRNDDATEDELEEWYGFRPEFSRIILPTSDNRRIHNISTKLWFQLASWSFAKQTKKRIKWVYDLIYTRNQYVALLCGGVFEAHQYSLPKKWMTRKCELFHITDLLRRRYGRGMTAHLGFRPWEGKTVPSEILYSGGKSKMGILKESKHDITVLQGEPPSQVAKHLHGAKVLVLPFTKTYDCPLKLIEYMSTRKPIVACDTPNIREIMGDNDFYFRPGNVGDMDEKIEMALEEPRVDYNIPLTWRQRTEEILGLLTNSSSEI